MLRVYRIPFSTNVERVSLALAHKGLDVEWEDVDPGDRSPVERLSGQPLVPVLVHDERVIADSTVILRYLEELQPEPPLFPRDEARAAELEVFLDWFNRIWKRPPNEIEAERGQAEPDSQRIDELGRELTGRSSSSSGCSPGATTSSASSRRPTARRFRSSSTASSTTRPTPTSSTSSSGEYLALNGGYPRLEAWIRRVDARPRA